MEPTRPRIALDQIGILRATAAGRGMSDTAPRVALRRSVRGVSGPNRSFPNNTSRRMARLARRSAVVATVGDLADDVALGDDPDRRLSIVDDDEPVDAFRGHLPGGFVQRRRP